MTKADHFTPDTRFRVYCEGEVSSSTLSHISGAMQECMRRYEELQGYGIEDICVELHNLAPGSISQYQDLKIGTRDFYEADMGDLVRGSRLRRLLVFKDLRDAIVSKLPVTDRDYLLFAVTRDKTGETARYLVGYHVDLAYTNMIEMGLESAFPDRDRKALTHIRQKHWLPQDKESKITELLRRVGETPASTPRRVRPSKKVETILPDSKQTDLEEAKRERNQERRRLIDLIERWEEWLEGDVVIPERVTEERWPEEPKTVHYELAEISAPTEQEIRYRARLNELQQDERVRVAHALMNLRQAFQDAARALGEAPLKCHLLIETDDHKFMSQNFEIDVPSLGTGTQPASQSLDDIAKQLVAEANTVYNCKICHCFVLAVRESGSERKTVFVASHGSIPWSPFVDAATVRAVSSLADLNRGTVGRTLFERVLVLHAN